MEPYIGQIELFSFSWAPEYWTICDGRLLDIQQFPALYSLLGTTYGGNGVTTFAVPNLQNANPLNGNVYCIALNGYYPPRS